MNKKFLATSIALTMTFGTLAAPVGESILTDNAVSVSAAKSVSETDRMRSAYRRILKKNINNPGPDPFESQRTMDKCPVAEHTVYDIDKNGVPELIIRFESFHFNQYMKIYSYNTKKHKAYLLKNISTSGRLEKDARSGNLLIQGSQMGYCFFNKIQLKNNKITIKSLKGVNSPAGDLKPDGTRVTTQEYKNAVEKFVIPAPLTKISGEKLIKNCYTDSTLKYHNGTEQYVDSDYLINHSKITTKKSSAKVTLSKQKVTKVKSGRNYVKVAWKKNKKASGYQIKLASNKKFKGGKVVKITKNKTTAKIIRKLKPGRKYYVKVRSYKKVGKKVYYGKWSTVKAIRTKSSK